MNYGSLSIGFVPVRRYAINRLCSISALDTLNQRRPTILQSSFENRSTTLDHKTLGKPFKRYQSTAQIYRWNDVLFGSTFNEIVRFETANFDLNQYSLFKEKNFIKTFDKGFFSLMPFVVRAYERLIQLVDYQMHMIGCQKIMMPSMVGKHLWVKSERWNTSGEEVFRVLDRHKNEFCLAPTQEETVTQILASIKQLTYRQLPIYLYQITPKYRDELRTKFGLLRAREFIMKDLYTFDKNEELAKETYEKVCQAYENLFQLLELPIIKTVGSVGSIGGKYSHEWLLETSLGEDEVYTCLSCQESFNSELVDELGIESSSSGTNQVNIHCPNCKSSQVLPKRPALELGHSFLLSDRYSSKMGAHYLSEHTNRPLPLQMGCYGLGISRILAGSVEYLSNNLKENVELRAKQSQPENDNTTIHSSGSNLTILRWPKLLVPFKVCLILPKKDSKEDKGKGTEFSIHLANVIGNRFNEDVLIDDRSNLTIGKRLLTARSIGIPFIIVAGKSIIENVPKFELINVYDDDNVTNNLFTQAELLNYLEHNLKQFTLTLG
ncbi:hypothetical protein RDWZM_006946 [Blomia tropicalis]|uniref:proline--tRNA ligase n=1 Tax=Blomia tropicalis TaxID=40697 RepID=A0A9Q0M976_BLOTA|nr:hypothetical protein RDWZM_006946 [Blomia tropicalis]